jgi:hypothetical protein
MKNIIGYKNSRISIYEELQNIEKIAILYPGYSYSLKSPVFAYLIDLLRIYKYHILGIDYRYNENNEFLTMSEDEKDEWIDKDSILIGNYVLENIKMYSKVMIIGKSLGTTIMMKQVKNNLIPKKVNLVWLTPGTHYKEVYKTIYETENKSLLIYGNKDQFVDEKFIAKLKERSGLEIREINNAGHSFDTEEDVERSIKNLLEVIKAIKKFMKN